MIYFLNPVYIIKSLLYYFWYHFLVTFKWSVTVLLITEENVHFMKNLWYINIPENNKLTTNGIKI